MRHENSLFSPGAYDPFLSLLSVRFSLDHLSALNNFIVRSDCKVFVPADFDSAGIHTIVIVETLTDRSDFWTTQLHCQHLSLMLYLKSRGNRPRAIARLGVDGSLVHCAGSDKRGIDVCCSR
jgi:hypothetical protein